MKPPPYLPAQTFAITLQTNINIHTAASFNGNIPQILRNFREFIINLQAHVLSMAANIATHNVSPIPHARRLRATHHTLTKHHTHTMKIYSDLTQLIGNTPLLEAHKLANALQLKGRLLLKVESFNPGGSVKDRVALAMIEDAEQSGRLAPGGTLIEPTSGNTGIGLAWIAAIKGYRLILTMPDTMSRERQQQLRALGAEIQLTPGDKGMNGAIERAQQLQATTPGAIILQQFNNKVCPLAHERTTGQELLRDTDGHIDAFIAGVGTGGTISGVAHVLKQHSPTIKIIAVEPQSSAVLSGGTAGPHGIQGIGAGFVPQIYDSTVIDEVMPISDTEAFEGMRLLTKHEGLFCGISSGAAIAAAIKTAQRPEFSGATIATLLPDTGERYLSLLN